MGFGRRLFSHAIEKLNRFSDFCAMSVTEATKRRSGAGLVLRLAVEFPLSFLKFYLCPVALPRRLARALLRDGAGVHANDAHRQDA
jgi:hypothetical protein